MPWREFDFHKIKLGLSFFVLCVGFEKELPFQRFYRLRVFSFLVFFFSHSKRVNLFPFSCNEHTINE